MTKKISPSSVPERRRTRKAPAAPPVDIATVAGTEPIESAADHSARTAVAEPTQAEIAEAAYRRYLGRGERDGADFDDWIEAERELRTRRAG
ncbi:MAG: DUF2934 domain-containing protein [Acidobacteria bacterium]|nr:DUF2934 domain-containing protein [Acidobacteriota bacterium]